MSKSRAGYFCRECGYESIGWLGRCPGCKSWNTMVEALAREPAVKSRPGGSPPVSIRDVPIEKGRKTDSGMKEFDRVLGGGLVAGTIVLLGGDPGIGKSTLLLQYAAQLAGMHGRVLYVSGEESPAQVRLRAERLGAAIEGLFVLGETDVEEIIEHTSQIEPVLLVVDSIQTMHLAGQGGSTGSVGQVRACAGEFLRLAKETGVSVFLVGHITKSGALAGPRVLEHMVDTVLYLEGEHRYNYRLLRAVKNRFGSTDELAVFGMEEKGLVEIPNPSAVFLADRAAGEPGAVVFPGLEGNQALLLELQALVAGSGYGTPRRLVSGLDYNRVLLVLAVLEKRLGLSLGSQDVYVSLTGGLRLTEPAADLASALAVVSSLREAPVPQDMVVFGEVGLAGEVRPVRAGARRLAEAARLGFRRAVLPEGESADIPPGMEAVGIRSVAQALEVVFRGGRTA